MTNYKYHKGQPHKILQNPDIEEWFLAKLKDGSWVCLTALPELHSYDYKTADDTHYTKKLISGWMQLPTSDFLELECDACNLNKDLSEALEPFSKAAQNCEKILAPRNNDNSSEWLSAFIHHVGYRLSYNNFKNAMEKLSKAKAVQ